MLVFSLGLQILLKVRNPICESTSLKLFSVPELLRSANIAVRQHYSHTPSEVRETEASLETCAVV